MSVATHGRGDGIISSNLLVYAAQPQTNNQKRIQPQRPEERREVKIKCNPAKQFVIWQLVFTQRTPVC